MSQRIEWRLEIDVVTVTNDTEGYGTPLTAVADNPIYGTKTLRFATTSIESDTTGYQRCITDFTLNTPRLKAGLGIASRNQATFTFLDFVGDPDLGSPALIANPDIEKRGTYFGKTNARHLLVNRPARLTGVAIGSSSYQYELLTVDLRQSGSDKWVLTCRDVLYRLEDEKTTFPASYSGNVTNNPGDSGSTIQLSGDASNWDLSTHIAVSGNDIMPITNVAGTASTTLTVDRGGSYSIGVRDYINNNEVLQQGESVFRGRRYENANLVDILQDIFIDSGIPSTAYDVVAIQSEIDAWVGDHSINCIFHEPKPSVDVLNLICQTFLIDIYTAPDNTIQVSSTTPFVGTTVRFIEGREITYGKGTVRITDDLRFSRALLKYGKLDQTDDTTYKANSFKFNSEYESEIYYDEKKLFTFEENNILGVKTRDKEIAETTAIRFVNRWAFRPLVADVEINKEAFDQVEIGDTIFIEHSQFQDSAGNISSTIRYQITKLQPLKNTFYRMEAISFLPYFGTSDGFEYDPVTGEITAAGPISINQDTDINLFLEAGSPEPNAQLTEYTFVIDSSVIGDALGQRTNNASIILGEGWATTGITFNIVCLGGLIVTSYGGNGGQAGRRGSDGSAGESGGTAVRNKSGQTINVYLSGSRTVQGIVYNCDGYLYAPGGGGGGGASGGPNLTGGAGAGGAGYPIGLPGLRPLQDQPDGTSIATIELGGSGEDATHDGGDGGNSGQDGSSGASSGISTGGGGGFAGNAIVLNSGIVNLYGAGRFIQGSGDAPTATIP